MLSHLDPNVVMGFYFSPRGGSAQVAKYLCRALSSGRWSPTLFAGSLGLATESGNADSFFRGVACNSLDYTGARDGWISGHDAMSGPVPMHASFEDKPGVPDRIFFELDDEACARQVASWTALFAAHSEVTPSVIHLHHLTPMHQAVRNLWPDVPVITHLHGTELKMLASVDSPRGSDKADAADARRTHDGSRFADQWVERMRGWALDSHRLVVVSEHDRALALELLPVERERIETIANGVDMGVFTSDVSPAPSHRRALWKQWLLDDPQGWRPGASVGSVRYSADDLDAFVDEDGELVPVVLFVGRFMQFKRIQLLIEAHHEMRLAGGARSVLVIAGGYPGEWEGEHPYDTVQRIGAHDVFLVGWRDHDDLAEILSCVDVFAAPAVDEPFGLVYLEAMAAGIAPIATATGGPLKFINVDPNHPTGWLVTPDDRDGLVRALSEAVSDSEQRSTRGKCAAEFVGEHYSWARSAQSFADLYGRVTCEQAG